MASDLKSLYVEYNKCKNNYINYKDNPDKLKALKDAKKKSLDRTQKEMAKITNELGLPENFKLPF